MPDKSSLTQRYSAEETFTMSQSGKAALRIMLAMMAFVVIQVAQYIRYQSDVVLPRHGAICILSFSFISFSGFPKQPEVTRFCCSIP